MRWDLPGSLSTPNWKFLASLVLDLRHGRGFKIQFLVTGPRPRPFWGYFVSHEMGLAKIYLYTKFDISSFTRSRFTKGVLKFNFWSLNSDHALFGGILSVMRWDLPGSIRTPNLKFLASPVPKIRRMCR